MLGGNGWGGGVSEVAGREELAPEGDLGRALRGLLAGIEPFSRGLMGGYALRSYQSEVALAIIESVRRGDGQQFAIVFAR